MTTQETVPSARRGSVEARMGLLPGTQRGPHTRRRKSVVNLDVEPNVKNRPEIGFTTQYFDNAVHDARILASRTVATSTLIGETDASTETLLEPELEQTGKPRLRRSSLSLSVVFDGHSDGESVKFEVAGPLVVTTAPLSSAVKAAMSDKGQPAAPAAEPQGFFARIRSTLSWIFARRKLYSYDELPAWLRASSPRGWIKSGYQAHLSGYRETWAMAISQFTNETINIWTHLLGGAVFVFLAARCFAYLHPAAGLKDRIVFGSYCALATKSLISSALFHAHFHLSENAYKMWCSLDVVGISFLTCGSGTLLGYYVFHGNANLQAAWLLVVILVNLIGVVGPAFEIWTSPHFRKMRVSVYSISGLLSVFPAMYIMATGLPETWPRSATNWIVGSFGSYILGTFIYLTQVPERFYPGLFDYVFSSHQLWHFFVVSGAYTMFRAGYDLFKWRIACA